MITYDLNAVACLTALVRQNDALVDPTTVSFSIVAPDGTEYAFAWPADTEAAKLSVGVFQVEQVVDVPGKWTWKALTTGDPVMAGQSEFYVRTDLEGQ